MFNKSTILIIGITIIAVIIAALVFMPGASTQNTQSAKEITITITRPAYNTVVVGYHGGKDADLFQGALVNLTTSTPGEFSYYPSTGVLKPVIGSEVAIYGENFDPLNHIVIIGKFSDIGKQTLRDTYI